MKGRESRPRIRREEVEERKRHLSPERHTGSERHRKRGQEERSEGQEATDVMQEISSLQVIILEFIKQLPA